MHLQRRRMMADSTEIRACVICSVVTAAAKHILDAGNNRVAVVSLMKRPPAAPLRKFIKPAISSDRRPPGAYFDTPN